jgi:hypothetical protein
MGVLSLLVAGTSASCSSRSARQQSQFQPITVQVENQNFNDVTVFLVWNTDRRRLGVVNGNTRSNFTSQWYGPTLELEIDVLAGRRYRSERISVNPGDELIAEIPSTLERIRIYRR